MLSQDMELQGTVTADTVPDWLQGLIQAVRGEGLQPKDVRVKSLWDLLRQRQLLDRSQWLRAMLRDVWIRGLPARERPRTTGRLVALLRRWGILPPVEVSRVVRRPVPIRPLTPTPVTVRPVRPVTMQTIRPVRVQPVARTGARR